MNAIIPIARCQITIRPAVMGDYSFIDRLQDMHSKALGFMPKAQLVGKLKAGHILIAEDETRLPIGYCMSQDRYFKRDDVGIVYQMNVSPGAQRKLVAATLLKAVFDRAAYGCRLFCCWCAQDLDANYFWESMGFVPLAFRTGAAGKRTLRGSSGRARTHVFWQRRIREGDTTTSYWYPSKTDGGMMREDRLVLPIPPGVHWKDAMPILLPEVQNALPGPAKKQRGHVGPNGHDFTKGPAPLGRVRFGAPPTKAALEQATIAKPGSTLLAAGARAKRQKVKADPAHVAAARELRDRYLEQFNSGLVLPVGKYEVSRQIDEHTSPMKMIAA